MLKNAVSYGSYNQGSVVTMGQEGPGNNGTSQDSGTEQKQEEPEKQESTQEPEQNEWAPTRITKGKTTETEPPIRQSRKRARRAITRSTISK